MLWVKIAWHFEFDMKNFVRFFFKTLDYVSREEYEIKGIPDFLFIRSPFQRHKLFLYQKTLNPNLTIFMFERVRKKLPYLK